MDVARTHQIPFQTFLWEYLGYPDNESPERKRILYAIVVLRVGFAALFLLRGWSALFAAPVDAFAMRLGDPARFGLSGAAVDTTLFIIGCTELGVGALLLFGAFTRVSAVTGVVLATLSLMLGERPLFPPQDPNRQLGDTASYVAAVGVAGLICLIGGLIVIVICGAPFLSADRALDKLEEEERDRAPAQLPVIAEATLVLLRLGLAGALGWYVAWANGQGSDAPLLATIVGVSLGVALMLGIGTWLLALPAVGFLFLWLVNAMGSPVPEWWFLAIPTVAVALIVAGPGSLRVGRWAIRRGAAGV